MTGSNAKLLSSELATHLTGRYAAIEVWPFSFREFLRLRHEPLADASPEGSTKTVSMLKRALAEYLATGGFPESYKFGLPMTAHLYSDIVEKDILVRHRIRQAETFKKVALYLLSNYAKEASFRKVGNVFDIRDSHTVSNYFGLLSSSYLLFFLEKFSPKLKMQHLANRKFYCIDHGLLNQLAFGAQDNSGRAPENVVFVELLRRKSYRGELDSIFFWQSQPLGHEVDFVLRKGRKTVELLQVCLNLSDPETERREIRALLLASQELRCSKLSIVTLEREGTKKMDGKTVSVVPLWKFLLAEPD